MKNLKISFAILLLLSIGVASAQEMMGSIKPGTPRQDPALGNEENLLSDDCWHWQNPMPQGNALHKVFFIDANVGWTVGDAGTILKTSNGGLSWEPQSSGTKNLLRSVHFADAQTGWAVGDYGTILKTSNGGLSWQPQTSGMAYSFWAVYFSNNQTGWAVGDNGAIFKTNNGGANWQAQSSGVYQWLVGVYFMDNQNGFAVGGGGTILRTSNGGSSWQPRTSGTTNGLRSVHFIDNQTGWIVGDNGTILKTSNGGSSWQPQTSGTTSYLYAVSFTGSQNGWAVGDAGAILRTSNGGSSWQSQFFGTYKIFYGVHFVNNQTGWTVGSGGIIWKTNDGGSSWQPQTSGTAGDFYDVYFTDNDTGWVAGWDPESNVSILKTVNGGASWAPQYTGTDYSFSSVHFTDNQTGWVVGYFGRIYKTSDGGSSWQSQSFATPASLTSVYFVDNQTGWAVGSGGTILKTSNGIDWHLQTSGTGADLNSLYFINTETGWAVGGNGAIQKTSDGGLSWQAQASGTTNYLNDVYFADNQNGWAVGQFGRILRTSNGGSSWQIQASGITDEHLYAVYFADNQKGWAVGTSGVILKTNDGGASWQPQVSGTANHLLGMHFNGSQSGWVVGSDNTILKLGLPAKPVTQNISYCQNSPSSPLTAIGSYLLWYTTPTGGTGSPTAPTPSTSNIGTTTYYVTQTPIGTGCGESERAALTVTITAPPLVTVSAVTPTCVGQSIGSVTVTAFGGTPPYTYTWSNGQTTATASNLAVGIYTVSVTANGCTSTAIATIPATPATSAGFTYTANFQTVAFANASANATTYAWDFGDGQTSTMPNPTVTFTNPGTYNVCMTATGTCGSASNCQAITITIPPTLTISASALNVGASSGSSTFDVTSNCSTWTIIGAPSWITTTPSSGSNNGTVTLNYQQNPSANARTATLTISGCGLTQTLVLTQSGVVASPWHIDSTGENHTIILPANLISDIAGMPLQLGDQIGVFYNASGTLKCGGYGIWSGSATSFAAYGNDAPAPAHNGFAIGEVFKVKIWRIALNQELDATVQYAPVGTGGIVSHTNTFANDGISMITSITAVTAATHAIALTSGWNMISSYIIPAEPDMLDVFDPIASSVDIVKDGTGTSTIPAFGVNNIGNWNLAKGYQVKANQKDTLLITGQKAVPESTPIPLQTGWQIIGYLRQNPQNIATVFSTIQGQISIVKDNFGKSYLPQFGINTIGDMMPGQGYRVKALSNVTLVYQANLTGIAEGRGEGSIDANTVHFILDSTLNTGNNATIILPNSIAEGNIQIGDEMGIFTPEGVLCGAASYQGENLAITVWGDDATTNGIIEGMQAGDAYHFKVWKSAEQAEYTSITTLVSGMNAYEADAIEVIDDMHLVSGMEEVASMGIQSLQLFPNPVSESLNIGIQSNKPGKVRMALYSEDGALVLDLKEIAYPHGNTGVRDADSRQNSFRLVLAELFF